MNVDDAFVSVWEQLFLFRKFNYSNNRFELLWLQTVIQIIAHDISSLNLILFQSLNS